MSNQWLRSRSYCLPHTLFRTSWRIGRAGPSQCCRRGCLPLRRRCFLLCYLSSTSTSPRGRHSGCPLQHSQRSNLIQQLSEKWLIHWQDHYQFQRSSSLGKLQSFQITKEKVVSVIAGSAYPLNHSQWFLKAQPQRMTSLKSLEAALRTEFMTTFHAGAHLPLRQSDRSVEKACMVFASLFLLRLAWMQSHISEVFMFSKVPVPCQFLAAKGCWSSSIRATKRQKEGETFIVRNYYKSKMHSQLKGNLCILPLPHFLLRTVAETALVLGPKYESDRKLQSYQILICAVLFQDLRHVFKVFLFTFFLKMPSQAPQAYSLHAQVGGKDHRVRRNGTR